MKKYIKIACVTVLLGVAVYLNNTALAVTACAILFFRNQKSEKEEELPMKAKKKKPIEYSAEHERLRTILSNIEAYDGSSKGQQKVR